MTRHLLLSAATFMALVAGSARANPSEGAIAASAPSSLGRSSKAELARFLNIPGGKTVVTATDKTLPRVASNSFDRLLLWNEVALDTTAIDHTPIATGGDPLAFGEQFGPHRASRAMAIVHIAMFDAANAIDPRFQSYDKLAPVTGPVSVDRAMAQAAHDTLVWLYPHQQARLDALLAQDVLTIVGDPGALAAGKALGHHAAVLIIKRRTNDGSELPEQNVGDGPDDFHVTNAPGKWSPDPVSGLQITFGTRWGSVKPFVLLSGDQYRPAPPPALDSAEYARSFNGVKALGADGVHTPTTRTARQSFIGRFWGYDGTPALCAPPRLYNMIARTVALQGGIANVTEMARYMALINTVMGDAGISAWDSKWFYQEWRPVIGIRNANSATNPKTVADPNWYPSGAPATNTSGPNFTPPFPAYPSGHATFGGALFETLRLYFPNMTKFTFISDEFNGLNRDVDGTIRPLRPETFHSLSEAEHDNAQSRIYNGVHWEFDATAGINEGHSVARFVMAHAFQRLSR